MTIELKQEGDYEIALDYKIEKSRLNAFGKEIFPEENYYRESFNFSVRNGNNMGFIFDNATKDELKNCSFTPNGFYVDMAGSKYISIDVKREELNTTGSEPTLDTRYNGTAHDGDQFTDEGIYTVTFRDEYESEPTTKTIYVGDNDLLKAYITTGLPLSQIQQELDNGAVVDANGKIIPADADKDSAKESDSTDANQTNPSSYCPHHLH